MNDPMQPIPWTITDFKWENRHTYTFCCESGQPLAFAPGQFNMLYVFGVGEVPISISGSASEPHHLVHTIRSVGHVTQAMANLKPGQQIGVRGPFGSAWPLQAAEGQDVLIIAGGLGLAPVRPILYHILARREHFGRVILLYGARNPQELLYEAELHHWRSHFDLEVQVTVDLADEQWHGRVGVIPPLIRQWDLNPAQTWAMICGPEILMRLSAQELKKRAVPGSQIFVSLERNMQCAIGFCGHCQYGPHFICKDGPVFDYDSVQSLLGLREV